MSTKKFSEAMSELDNKYVEEAMNYKKKAKKPVWLKWGTMVACLAVVVVTAFCILPQFSSQPIITPSNDPDSIITNEPSIDENIPPEPTEIHISMDNIFLNEMGGLADASHVLPDPELYDYIKWDKNLVIDYYGKDLTPVYIPDGLTASTGNGTATVIADKSGKIVEDTVWLDFYHDYYGDGSPKLTGDVSVTKGFSIAVSKIGLLNDCLYLLPENEVKTSNIDGTAVTFGYRSMPYGPYAPDTHEPTGYYDMYVAEFEKDGIEFQIVANQMEVEELVKVTSSIICGENVILDK